MKYDFDRIIDRRSTDSIKYGNAGPDVIPLWVADMDFASSPEIKEALMRRVNQKSTVTQRSLKSFPVVY